MGSWFLLKFFTWTLQYVCTWRYVYGWTHRKPLERGQGGLFYLLQLTYDPWEWCTNSIKPSTGLKKRGAWRIWCWTFFLFNYFVQNSDKLRRYKQKTYFGTFTSSSLFSNSSNLRGEISNMLFHCQIRCFLARGGFQRSPKNGFRVLLRVWKWPWTPHIFS